MLWKYFDIWVKSTAYFPSLQVLSRTFPFRPSQGTFKSSKSFVCMVHVCTYMWKLMLGVFLCHSISEAASDSVRKSGQQVQSTPFLPSQHWVTGTNHNAQLLCECWECEPRSSCLQGKHFSDWTISLGSFSQSLLDKDFHLTLMNVWAEVL